MAEKLQQLEVVFLRRNIPEPFTYLYTGEEDLRGFPVVVPLHNQLTVGLVIGSEPAGEEAASDLKEIAKIVRTVDPLPVELMELARWMSRYYLTSAVDTFRSLLPSAYLPRPETAWELVAETEKIVNALPASIASVLQECEDLVTLRQLKEAVGWAEGKVVDLLSQLEEEELLKRTVSLSKPPTSRRKLNYLKLTAEPPRVESFLADASTRQAELINYLRDREGEFQAELPAPLRRTDLIRRLQEEDLIVKEKRHRYRLPLEEMDMSAVAEEFELTAEQERVYKSVSASIETGKFESHLLHGVTGSGKTEVYFRLVEQVLARGETALVLVPEITLAVFLFKRFRARFGEKLAILHSGLSQGERRDEWHRAQRGEARVVLGVQSAVFAPLSDLGLIVVDEEHDSSYKAGSSPRYNARDVAVKRAQINEAPVLLGSATPGLESYSNALQGRYQLHEMKQRPTGGQLPEVNLADLRSADGLFTKTLVKKTKQVLSAGHRAIWFLNRRGYSNYLLCTECGEALQCHRCRVSLTYHSGPGRLRCHYCGYARTLPNVCPGCEADGLQLQGSGTQQLTRVARELFPRAQIIRMDADTVTRKNQRFALLERFGGTKSSLLIGTQMVTKGLDFEGVDFVGVVNVDTGLQFPDFRAGERTFQQLVQVCGRAGRDKPDASVLIQTYNPRHYAVQLGARADYENFVTRELNQRQPLSYPPFSRLIDFVATGPCEEDVISTLEQLLEQLPEGDYEVLGPAPCGLQKIKGRHRWHLLLRGNFSGGWRRRTRELIGGQLDYPTEVRLIPNVDPADVL